MKLPSSTQARFLLAFSLLAPLGAAGCKSHSAGGADAGDGSAPVASATVSAVPAPPDVAAPPADAVKTASGLATKVLTPGTGTEHPGMNDTVKVNYTGWTTDGKMFDSTEVPRMGRKAEPTTLMLNRVIPGWNEGIQQMVVGEKRRLWIPEELAYKGRRGAPPGMLVFDVELLDITPGPKAPADVAAPPADAVKTSSGLASKVTQPGTGKVHPGPNDGVRVNFSTWHTDGRLLDESRDKPVVRPVSGQMVPPGWTEAIQQMVVGEKRTFWIPAALTGPTRPGEEPTAQTTLVELVDILPGPKTPPDVKAPPKDAIVEKDGLATKVLVKGTGKEHPTKTSAVTVNYAGWTTDGKMFDSSYTRGQPATFAVGGVIPGWGEALQLMVEGEKRRIWIPEALAYKGQPNRPQGTLVFDVELLKIAEGPAMGPHGMMPGQMPPHGMMGGHPPMGMPPQGTPPQPPASH